MKKPVVVAAMAGLLLAGSLEAEKLRIATWNAQDLFSVEDVVDRSSDFAEMAKKIKPDILLLQEVTSVDVVEKIRESMGAAYSKAHVACSDFNQDDHDKRASFEVAIISKYPLTQVVEFDPTPDNQLKSEPAETGIEKVKNVSSISTSRGYLWAEIHDLSLTVASVHLKSSRGEQKCSERRANARKRERISAAMAVGVVEDMSLFKGYTYVLGGDFNVGHAAAKNGKDLKVDCCGSGCGGKDRYDETHALLTAGLISGLKMTNLSGHLAVTSYPGFAANSPIDNIFVAGEKAGDFSPAKLSGETFGSDHLLLFADLSF